MPTTDAAYAAAREQFDRYCSMDEGELPDDPGARLQVRLFRWAQTSFGHKSNEFSSGAGVVEELGEMAEAVIDLLLILLTGTKAAGRLAQVLLKRYQGIRGMDDPDTARRAIADALADMVVFGMQVATCFRLDLWTLLEVTANEVMQRDWTKNKLDGTSAVRYHHVVPAVEGWLCSVCYQKTRLIVMTERDTQCRNCGAPRDTGGADASSEA